MGRAQQNRTNELNETVRSQQAAKYTDYGKEQIARGHEFLGQSREPYAGAMGVYNTLAQGYAGGEGGDGGGGGGGGGVGGQGYATQTPMYRLNKFDPSNIAEAKAGYDEFAKTGGYSDQDQAMYRARGNAQIPSFYSNLQQQLANRRNVQGGYGAGFDAAAAKMARQAAQQSYQGQIDTEAGLQGAIREGRQWGIGGQSELGRYKSDWELQQDIAQGGLSEAFANRQDRAGMFSAGEANSASGANAALSERAREFNAEQDFARRQEAGRGYSGLYGTSGELDAASQDRWLRGLGQEDVMQGGAIGRQYEYNRPWGGALAGKLISGVTGSAGSGWLSKLGGALGKFIPGGGRGGDPNAGGEGSNYWDPNFYGVPSMGPTRPEYE